MTDEYKTPLLASLFGLVGILAGLAFLILLGFAVVATVDVGFGQALPTYFLAGWALLAMIIYFGIGQVIDAICRTAYFAQQTAGLTERIARAQEITQQSIAHIIANPPTGTHAIHPGEPRGYYYVHDGKVEGPYPEAKIRRLFNSGEITDETLAMRKGDHDWVPLGKLFPH